MTLTNHRHPSGLDPDEYLAGYRCQYKGSIHITRVPMHTQYWIAMTRGHATGIIIGRRRRAIHTHVSNRARYQTVRQGRSTIILLPILLPVIIIITIIIVAMIQVHITPEV